MARTEEIGMQVVGNELRLDLEDRSQVLDRVDQRRAGRRVVEIADVLRHERLVAAGHAHGVLEMAAQRDDGRPGSGELDRPRRVAPRPANELESRARAVGNGAQHAVVAACDDDAVVHEQGIGDAGKPPDGLMVAGDQRLASGIRARHHQNHRVRRSEPCAPAGRPAASWNSRYCSGVYGSIAPSQARPGATPGRRASATRPCAAARSAARPRRAAPHRRASRLQRAAAKRCWRPSPRRAFLRATCARADAPPRRRCARRRRDGSRPSP